MTTEGPDEQAAVLRTEAEMIGEIADRATTDTLTAPCSKSSAFPPTALPTRIAPDYLDRLCKEYLADWKAERSAPGKPPRWEG